MRRAAPTAAASTPSCAAGDRPLVADSQERAPPVEATDDFRLILELYAEDGYDPQVAREKLVDLYRALNQYNLAKNGRRLTVEKFREYVFAGVPVEV